MQRSDWFCSLEELSEEDRKKYAGPFAVRMGLRYVKGLRKKTGQAIEEARQMDGPFASEYDFRRRVVSAKKTELTLLATTGAFNWTGKKHLDVQLSGTQSARGRVADRSSRMFPTSTSSRPPHHYGR